MNIISAINITPSNVNNTAPLSNVTGNLTVSFIILSSSSIRFSSKSYWLTSNFASITSFSPLVSFMYTIYLSPVLAVSGCRISEFSISVQSVFSGINLLYN